MFEDVVRTVFGEDSSLWQVGFVIAVLIYLLLSYLTLPRQVKSPEFYNHKSTKTLKMKRKAFPPPYPNGWHRLCNSNDVPFGKIKAVSALGREFAVFRNADNKVGVIDAYCPHLGAHLPSGGKVTKDGNIQCPFHSWEFNTSGKAVKIPYCTKDVPERAKTQSYVVREHLGYVLIWFHCDTDKLDKPEWELEFHKDVLENDKFYFVTSRCMTFDQHCLEMHMNSADFFHFQTLHAPLPLPVLENILFGRHTLDVSYENDKKDSETPHLCFFEEQMITLNLFGKIPIMPRWILDNIKVRVVFEGPTIVHFSVKTIFGEMRMIKTILPVKPFLQHVEARWFAEATVPRVLAYAMSVVAAKALEQDREVWENKMYKEKPLLVSGDGPFPAFKRYYMQFYSENSKKICENELEW